MIIENFEDNDSAMRHILCGVPQGSILGPLLNLIYVNDISKVCDSKTLFCLWHYNGLSHLIMQTLFANANCYMNELYTYICANKLSLNASKTKYIVIRLKQRKWIFDLLNLEINGMALQRIGEGCPEKSTKFLGIYLDEFITWKAHLSHVNRKQPRALLTIKQKHPPPPLRYIKSSLFCSGTSPSWTWNSCLGLSQFIYITTRSRTENTPRCYEIYSQFHI